MVCLQLPCSQQANTKCSTVAGGNSGASGLFQASAPGGAKDAISVASVDNVNVPRVLYNASYSIDGGPWETTPWAVGRPDRWENVTLPLWVQDYNLSDFNNACGANKWPDTTPDLSGYIVLMMQGPSCADWYKAEFAQAKGARYVLFFPDATDNPDPKEYVFPCV